MRQNRYIILLLAVIFSCSELSAQKMTMGFIFPAGGEQGSSVDIEIGGLNISGATTVDVSGEGVTAEIIPLKEKKAVNKKLGDQSAPQLADRIGVRVNISSDAECGLRNLRLQSPNGVSNQLSFEVSSYPNFVEVGESSLKEPNIVKSIPSTLCGQVTPGGVDYFMFKAQKGDKIVAEVKGRIFIPYIADAVPGWFQPVAKIFDSKGREVAYSDDYKNSPDPVIFFDIPESGEYTIAIHDAIFRGREDFNYRIQLGVIPFIESVFPLTARIGKSSKLEVSGVNLNRDFVEVNPKEAGINWINSIGKNGKSSNKVAYWALGQNDKFSSYPNEDFIFKAKTTIFDTIDKPYSVKRYSLNLVKGETITLEAYSKRLGMTTDLSLALISESGEELAHSDDNEDLSQGLITFHSDPEITFTAKDKGVYFLEVKELLGRSGKESGYVLQRGVAKAPYKAFVTPAIISIPQGGTQIITLDFLREEKKYQIGEVNIEGSIDGLNISSLNPIPSTPLWDISLSVPKDAKTGKYPLDIFVNNLIKNSKSPIYREKAKAIDKMMQAFYYIHNIEADEFCVEIVPALPYSIRFEEGVDGIMEFEKSDSIIPIKIIIDREKGFTDELELTLFKKGAITLEPIKVIPEEREKIIYLKVDKAKTNKYKFFWYPLSVSATVNGVVTQQGLRSFSNAKYKALSPILILYCGEMYGGLKMKK